jgi:hypothetical protein
MALNHSSRDAEHNNAIVLKAYVEAEISGSHKGQRAALPLGNVQRGAWLAIKKEHYDE